MADNKLLGQVTGGLNIGADLLTFGQEGKALRGQASDYRLQAKLEELNAKTTEGDLRGQLDRTLASNIAAFSGSNIALGSPLVAATMEADAVAAGEQISALNVSAKLKAGQLRRNAKAADSAADTSDQTDLLNLGVDVLSFAALF